MKIIVPLIIILALLAPIPVNADRGVKPPTAEPYPGIVTSAPYPAPLAIADEPQERKSISSVLVSGWDILREKLFYPGEPPRPTSLFPASAHTAVSSSGYPSFRQHPYPR